jgi:hypothetical protein
MEFTAEELAIYGLIDADTYIRLTEAAIAGGQDATKGLPTLDARTRRKIRKWAAERWQQARSNPTDTA